MDSKNINQVSLMKWSPRFRHTDISIKGKTIMRIEKQIPSLAGCLGNIVMNDTGNAIYRWSVRIDSMQRWLWVGMGQIQKASQQFSKTSRLPSIGHGHYCIC